MGSLNIKNMGTANPGLSCVEFSGQYKWWLSEVNM